MKPRSRRALCSAVRNGDGAFCPGCGLAWDQGEKKPHCPLDTPKLSRNK